MRRFRTRAGIARANCSSVSSRKSLISSTHVRLVKSFFSFRGGAGTDKVDCALLGLGPNHDDQTANDQSDGDETLLHFGVFLVEDLKIVVQPEEARASSNEMPCFLWFEMFLASSHETFTAIVYAGTGLSQWLTLPLFRSRSNGSAISRKRRSLTLQSLEADRRRLPAASPC